MNTTGSWLNHPLRSGSNELTMSKNKIAPHILIGSNLLIFFTWLFRLNFSIKGKSILRLLLTFFILLSFLPFRIIEHILYFFSKKEQVKAPVFIIGHPRSGTTFIHESLNEMESMAAPRMLDCLFPFMNKYFAFILIPLLQKKLPETRLMDKMKVLWNSPQEEEFGMAIMSGHSAVNFLFAPSLAHEVLNDYILMKNEKAKRKWQRAHLRFAKKIQSINKGKTLVFKSPGNTARVSELLEIYPDAKFIHIVRNPMNVIPSTFNLYAKILPEFSLQNTDNFDLDAYVFLYYREIMDKYLDTRGNFSNTKLYELKYEDFIQSPVETLNNVFNSLGINKDAIELKDFFAARKTYQKNVFNINEELSDRILKECSRVIDVYAYTA